MDLTRRELLRALGLLIAGGGLACVESPRRSSRADAKDTRRIPLIHTTDLYHPPQDPDDQIDLATVFALREYVLEAVILDTTEKFLRAAPAGFDIAREPGYVPVAQMAHITGRPVPAAQGPVRPLRYPNDTCEDATAEEQAGIQMILDILAASSEPVTISVTGSPRALTAAYYREPALLSDKTHTVLLNAGSTGGSMREWNVQLDPLAYVGLWQSDLPIDWFPPATESGAFDPAHERGTYWKAEQADLFQDVPQPLRGYFAYALTGDLREEIIDALTEQRDEAEWRTMLSGERNLWSTASLVMGASRVLARTDEGWRFLAESESGRLEVWPWRLDPIRAEVDETAAVTWEVVNSESNRRIFGRRPGGEFGAAMTEALNTLLRELAS
jgi:pyrimidine-specific ribonucleoside hydrolase